MATQTLFNAVTLAILHLQAHPEGVMNRDLIHVSKYEGHDVSAFMKAVRLELKGQGKKLFCKKLPGGFTTQLYSLAEVEGWRVSGGYSRANERKRALRSARDQFVSVVAQADNLRTCNAAGAKVWASLSEKSRGMLNRLTWDLAFQFGWFEGIKTIK